jgi:LisH-like dimerisation domain
MHKLLFILPSDTEGHLLILCCSVIKIVLQFCKENSLHQTFQTLQNECQVSLNTVDSIETFISDVNSGRWDAILPQVAQLKLSRKKLEDLYEQVLPFLFLFSLGFFLGKK